ncbi:MAG: multidrug efflux RND transporter permease subunit [Methylomonas sp.]|jgi:multidrug efflux pump|uniref:multidrug efflux RND transporter permease subunit n=1 Tax=Methylomonas sp. TaxID=418 RepID=UPI0025F8546F|nr:multidrug efflux RND transporter permease subunit [Methylomonas sp.]MCK9608462.1 multidrug efflux RND transporter permease subunit [Methylomonas sp.]
MNFSALFIRRPVATTLLTIGLALAGLMAFLQLPVAPLPQVDFPTISVSAGLPGASPETMAATIATPLERSLGRIAGITEMTSASSVGTTGITLQFDLDRDIDGAARDVQAAINAASSLLPANLPSRPRYRKVNPSDSPILILSLTSEILTRGQMYDAASTILEQKISQIDGIGQVRVGGSSLPAVRVELNPNMLAKYQLSMEEVRRTIAAANANRPKGAIDEHGRHWQIQANDQAKRAEDYNPLIVAYRNGAPIRIADLGEAVDSVEDLRNAGVRNGRNSVLLILYKQPGSNIIETVERVKAMLPQLQALLPNAMNLSVAVDRSLTIRASVDEVERSLMIAVALVIMVILLFLRKLQSALIPIIAVPVSLLGACGVMYLCGYSLDNLSLMALTIATGFVVDDAIVVLENISRHIEKGQTPYQAALHGAREVGFTVVSMSLSLIAVFIPILLMGGIVGRLFREFAVTLSAAVLVSLLVSLTVTPMLCARWLKPEHLCRPGRLSRYLERLFVYIQSGYRISLRWALRHAPLMLAILLVCIALNVYLYTIVPKGFFPVQDNGRLAGSIQADQSISFQAMQKKLLDFADILRKDPEVTSVVGFAGGGQNSNTGRIFAVLREPEQRRDTIDDIMKRLRTELSNEPGASLFLQPIQDLRIGGRSSAALYQFTLQTENLDDLREWTPKILAALQTLPELVDVNTDQQDKGQQISLQVDRDKAARYGVSQAAIDTALNNAFGQRQVSVIYNPLNQYHVIMELAPEYWQSPQILKQLYVTPDAGTGGQSSAVQIPLAALAGFKPGNAPLTVNHQGQFAASTLSFNLKPGVSLSDATRLIENSMKKIGAPNTLRGSFQGSAKAFQESLSNQPWLIAAALATIYIVLGVLYESYIHPLTILSSLPSAGMGAILALMVCDTEFSIIALIGVILLIGIVKKNAIMMIDFALQAEREGGLSSEEAIFQACLLRFRPIMMTTLAAMLGALPLAMASGYGAEFRQPLGISIVGGLLVSQLLTLYTTPVVYLYLDRLSLAGRHWFKDKYAAHTI